MLYTNQSSFHVRSPDEHEHVWRVNGGQWQPECHHPFFRSVRETVIVRGGFWYGGRTKLVRVEGRVNGPKFADRFHRHGLRRGDGALCVYRQLHYSIRQRTAAHRSGCPARPCGSGILLPSLDAAESGLEPD